MFFATLKKVDMMKKEELKDAKDFLESLNLQGWGDCGFNNGEGYLYPIENRVGGYMDNCLPLEEVVAILSKSKGFSISDYGHIDIW